MKYISSGTLPQGGEENERNFVRGFAPGGGKINEMKKRGQHFDRGSAPGEGRKIENILSRALPRGKLGVKKNRRMKNEKHS